MKGRLLTLFDDKLSLAQTIGLRALLSKLSSKKKATVLIANKDAGAAAEPIDFDRSAHCK